MKKNNHFFISVILTTFVVNNKDMNFKCKICGEIDITKFYQSNRSKCKSCISKKNKLKYAALDDNEKKKYIAGYRKWQVDNIIKFRWLSARNRARKNNMEFSITPTYLTELLQTQNNKCPYLDIEFDNKSRKFSISLDRIDPSKGYIEGNVQWICSIVNIMKFNCDNDMFIQIIARLYSKVCA